MKNVTYEEARAKFETLFELAAKGELVVIARNDQRVAVHAIPNINEQSIAPPGFFNADYDADEIAELNALAAHGPQSPVP
jgi:hypothetical protein